MTSTTQSNPIYLSARQHAPDFYISALLAPRTSKYDLITLAALIGEIETIPLKVSEPLIGEIRIQWWRDWLDGLERRQSSGVPVADALAPLISRSKLPPSLFMKLFDSRTSQIYKEPYTSLEKYFADQADFYGSAFALAARILDPMSSPALGDVDQAAQSAGRAYGTARLITCLRDHAAQGYWPLPSVPDPSPEKNNSGTPLNLAIDRQHVAQRRRSVEYAIASARQELSRARQEVAQLHKKIQPSFLPLALVEPYFKAFESSSGDPLMMRVEISPLARLWKLWRASF